MKKSFQRVIATLNLFQGKQSLTIFLLAAIFALIACDDSSSADDDDNNVILSGDSREESSDSRSNDKDEAISSSGKVTDKDSDAKSSDSKSNDPAEVTDGSSDSKDSPSSAGTSTKSSNSEEPDSSGSEGVEGSSASVPGGSSDASAYDVVTGTLTDSRDGQTYRTVKIGDKVWMAENLNYAYTGVPYKYGSYTSDSTSWCYGNDPANCAKYGRLYTWAAAMDSAGTWSTNGKGCGYHKTCSPIYPVRGVCPEGWHLPTQSEWNTLFKAVGGSSVAGTKLKSTSGWNSSGNGTDAFSFSALPAGLRNLSGNYDNEGNYAYFWSSTEHYNYNAYRMYLNCDYDDASLDVSNMNSGFSVRCVKDSK